MDGGSGSRALPGHTRCPQAARRVRAPGFPRSVGSPGVAIATNARFWTPQEAHCPAATSAAPMESCGDAPETEECWKIIESLESTIEQFRSSPR